MGAFGVAAATGTVPSLLQAMLKITDRLEPVFPGRVALDVKDLNPPGLYLGPPVIHYRFGQGSYALEHTLLVCASNTANRIEALADLADMLQRVQQALGDRAVLGRPADVWNQDQTAILAAYELTWTDQYRY
jgi:hypothetical protein